MATLEMTSETPTIKQETRNSGKSRPTIAELQKTATRLRIEALAMIHKAQSGHPGTSLSCLDILTALWFAHMRHEVNKAEWAERDRFVMSKGHGAPALYAVLMEAGYIPWEEKDTLRQIHSNLQGHPASEYVKGVDVSTGSLGQGLSCAVGMALGHRLDKSDARVFALLGDGESQEGNIWEAVMSAAHHKVSRLTAIVDRNKLQIDGDTEKVKALGEMAPKFAAFGWNTIEIDGHDYNDILSALDKADMLAEETDRPTVIIANCVKGKDVSFMENKAQWHGVAPNDEEFAQAKAELETKLQAI